MAVNEYWRTYPCVLGLFPHDLDTFHDGGSGVVDAIEERLRRVSNEVPYSSRRINLELYHRSSIMWLSWRLIEDGQLELRW